MHFHTMKYAKYISCAEPYVLLFDVCIVYQSSCVLKKLYLPAMSANTDIWNSHKLAVRQHNSIS